jgi:hypothetical protein
VSITAYGLRWQSIVDFVVLAPSLYLLLRWSRDARALRVTIGILGLEVGALVAGQFDLVITVWVLHAAAVGAGVVLIGTPRCLVASAGGRLAAAFSLAGAGRGALLVLTRHDSVNELLRWGFAWRTPFARDSGSHFPQSLAGSRRRHDCRRRSDHAGRSIVAATSLVAGTIVRVRTVPIEAVNIAPGLRVVDPARADVHNLSEGVDEIGLQVPGPLPLGVTVEAGLSGANHVSPSTSQGHRNEFKAGAMTMAHSRRTSFDCQLVDAYLVSLQSDIEAKWRDIRSIRDDIHLLMPRAGASAAGSEAVRTITERLDRMRSTNRIVRDTLLEFRRAAHTLAQDLEDEST